MVDTTHTTDVHGWEYPGDGYDEAAPSWADIIQAIIEDDIDDEVILKDTFTNRPAASTEDRWFLATDRDTLYYDDGSNWRTVGGTGTDSNPIDELFISDASAETLEISGWDMVDVTQEGVDNTGANNVTADVESLLADNTALVFPSGTYEVSSSITANNLSNVALLGMGDVTIKIPGGHSNAYWLSLGSASEPVENLRVSGFTVDITDTDAGARFGSYLSGKSVIKDIKYTGFHDSGYANGGPITNRTIGENSVTHYKNISLLDGSADDTQVSNITGGMYIGPETNGRVVIEDSSVEGFSDNGLYSSNANGPIIVKNCRFANNGISNVRLGGDASIATGVTIENREGEGHNGRGIWFRNCTEAALKDSKIRFDVSNTGSSPAIRKNENAGKCTVENTLVDVGGFDGNIIVASPPDGSYDNDRLAVRDSEIVGAVETTDDRLFRLNAPTVIDSCEMDITTTTTDVNQVSINSVGIVVTKSELTADVQLFNSFGGDECQFIGNNLESTDGSNEIDLDGANHIAVGNIVANGISITGEETANINLSA